MSNKCGHFRKLNIHIVFPGQLTDSILFPLIPVHAFTGFVTTDISKPAWLLNAVASKTQ